MGATSSSCSSTDLRRILAGRPTAPRSRSTAAAMGWSRISSIPAPASCARWSRRIRPSRSSGGGAWSPDGERLACEGFGVDDPSLTGIYWVRSSDGADLEGSRPTRVEMTSRRLLARWGPSRLRAAGRERLRRDLRNRRRRLGTPSGLTAGHVGRRHLRRKLVPGRESDPVRRSRDRRAPQGDLGGERPTAPRLTSFRSMGPVAARSRIRGRSGVTAQVGRRTARRSCSFVRPRSVGSGSFVENVYTVNADGSELFQVTSGSVDDNPDWGTPPASS
jgi:hypothetical protein